MDTGYTKIVVDDDLFNKLVDYFGAFLDAQGTWKVDCNPGKGYVSFGFGDADAIIVSVPFSELAINNFQDDTGGCIFGFEPAGDNQVISFGDTFLRSAYVVYNYDEMTISLAQASYEQSCKNCAVAI